MKSKSALSKYVNSVRGMDNLQDRNSLDFDEIPSVQLRAELNAVGNPKKAGVVPDISLSNANISYTLSSQDVKEEEKLLKPDHKSQ
jgi:hypothetical protein